MKIVFDDIHPAHFRMLSKMVSEILERKEIPQGLVASTEFVQFNIWTTVYIYKITDSILTVTYKEIE